MLSGLHTTSAPGDFIYPDNLPYSRLLDYEQGGVALSNPSQGVTGYVWSCRAVGQSIQLKIGDGAWEELFTHPAPYELSFAFDQNMRPLVAVATKEKVLSLYWFDPTQAQYTTTVIGAGRSPRLSLDDKRAFANAHNDVILAYISGSSLVYRVQRERFESSHVAATGIPAHARLKNFGMCTNLRVQFTVSS